MLFCVDGSDLSVRAVTAGAALLRPDVTPLVVTVVEPPDSMMVTGTGMAGGTMAPAEYDALLESRLDEGRQVAADAAARLGLAEADTRVLTGSSGPAICTFAAEVDASAVVLGSRGRGGVKRALLGSVSDHVVRNAPCPVVVTGVEGLVDDDG